MNKLSIALIALTTMVAPGIASAATHADRSSWGRDAPPVVAVDGAKW